MARSFSSPQGAPPKMKGGKTLPKIKHGQHGHNMDTSRDPLRFASKRLASFASRHSHTNNKSGFNTTPAHSPSGRLAQRAGKPSRGSGKEHRALL